MSESDYVMIEPIEHPPCVRLGYKWGDGCLYEAYSHPDIPGSSILINRSSELVRKQRAILAASPSPEPRPSNPDHAADVGLGSRGVDASPQGSVAGSGSGTLDTAGILLSNHA